MRIQAVTFDVGGTLIEPWPSVGHVYAEVAAQHGIGNLTAELMQTRFQAAWRSRPAFQHTLLGWQQFVDETFQGLTATPPSQSFFPALYQRFAQPETWRIYEDVLPTLDSLQHRGVRLGVISNWDERLRPLLRQLQLDSFFETVSISCEVGFAKPNPAIFAHAASLLKIPPAGILHVGDSLDADARGARAAGFIGKLLCRPPRHAKATDLRDLSELLTLIVEPDAKSD